MPVTLFDVVLTLSGPYHAVNSVQYDYDSDDNNLGMVTPPHSCGNGCNDSHNSEIASEALGFDSEGSHRIPFDLPKDPAKRDREKNPMTYKTIAWKNESVNTGIFIIHRPARIIASDIYQAIRSKRFRI